jgi:hypothetical protein
MTIVRKGGCEKSRKRWIITGWTGSKRDGWCIGVVKKGCRKSKQAPAGAAQTAVWVLGGMGMGRVACAAQHYREGRRARLCFVRIAGRLRKSDGGFHFCC